MKRPFPHKKGAFTLTEVLMLTGIIALLVVMVLFGTGRLIRQAQKVKSIGNLRQIGNAGLLFAGDNNNALLPYRLDFKSGTEMWYHKLFPYFNWEKGMTGNYGGLPDVFYCPVRKKIYAINRICGWGDGKSQMKDYIKRGQGVLPNSATPSWTGALVVFDLPGSLNKTAWFTTANGSDFSSQNQRSEEHDQYLVFPHNDFAAVLMMDASVNMIKNPEFAKHPEIRARKEWVEFFGYFAY